MLSVIIPIYNTPYNRFITCISSILQNNYSDLEVIIIDDGSKNFYSALYKEYCSQIKEIKYFKIANSGPSAARNYGFTKSIGDYIIFIDADDYIAPYFFTDTEKIIQQLKYPDMIIGLMKYAYNDSMIFKNNSLTLHSIESFEDKAILINHMLGQQSKIYFFNDLGYISDGPVARVVKREIFKYNKFDENILWNEDTIWNIKILHDCQKVVIANKTWYAYYENSDSATNKFRENSLKELLEILPMEFNVMQENWGQYYSGIYYMMYKDFRLLNRTYIFHKNNTDNMYVKFCKFKYVINETLIKDALKYIINHHKILSVKQFIMHIFYFDLVYGFKVLAFCMLLIKHRFRI